MSKASRAGNTNLSGAPRMTTELSSWPHPFRYQSIVKIPERTFPGGGLDRRTFEYIFELVIVDWVESPNQCRLLGSLELPSAHNGDRHSCALPPQTRCISTA